MQSESPLIELYSIGTELVYGRIQDTNSFWMAQQITRLGGRIRRITQLTDDLDDILAALRGAMGRDTDVIITSGGLGPTPDDLTNMVLSTLSESPLEPHGDVLDDYMRRRNIASREEISPNLVKMATIPTAAQVMLNPVGWAPCTRVDVNGTTFLALPGPPHEMEAVFNEHILPLLSKRYNVETAVRRVFVDTYESDVSPLLQRLMQQYPGSYLKGFIAMRSHPGWLPVEILASAQNAEQAEEMLDAIVISFREMLDGKGKQLRLSTEMPTTE